MWIFGTVIAVTAVAFIGMGAWVTYVNSVEKPAYRVVRADGDIEIRDYPPLVVAEVTRSGRRSEAVNAGFGPLANYIFARERGGEKISMTAPVTQTSRDKIAMTAPVTQERTDPGSSAGDTASWTVRFIMPSKYRLSDLPKPASSDIRLQELPAERVVAIRFSGVATDALIAEKEAELRVWAEREGVATEGAPTYAYYNDPFTPGFLRRNEVLLRVSNA